MREALLLWQTHSISVFAIGFYMQGFIGDGPIKTISHALAAAKIALLRSHSEENGRDTIGNDINPNQIQIVKDSIRIYQYFGDPETKLRY